MGQTKGHWILQKFFLLLFISTIIAGCSVRARKFEKFYASDPTRVTHLVIEKGDSGEMRKVTDQKEIDAFFDLLYSLSYIMEKSQTPRDGYLYWVEIYENDANILLLTLTQDTARINNVYYLLDKDIKGELDELFRAGGSF
jgi:hypothetical protein